jgi:class 3 adenylate cyclase/tetratricopeptide (TPR) repeat protein
VLFTDLVGSTELASRLDPRAADNLRQTHFGLLRRPITSAGGTEVKNLGDGLMVAFTSLSRALACAVGMQQAIERHNRRAPVEPLSVRIGVSTGEASVDDGDYFGDPVIEASRLCALARGGQILATEMVKAMAGRHAAQEFASVGDLELKGLPGPVPTVEVIWEPVHSSEAESEPLPLPARLMGASAESLFAFFGRSEELNRLIDTHKASASENRLRVTLVSGEPGIGKTSLVAQASRIAYGAGASILYGHCEEDLSVPYQPWITALSQLIDHADENTLAKFVESNGLALARLLPGLARRVSMVPPVAGTDADAERFLILEGVARLLAMTSTTTPVVVVLDDLHWADAASLQLLRHLVASALPMAALVVGTFRESDLSRSHPLTGALADLRREACVDRIALAGLEDIDIIDLLEAAAGHEMTHDGVALAHAIRRETAGNPFFVVEVVRHLAETGAFVQDDKGHWTLSGDLDSLGLPASVREVVAHRVARLGQDTERALSLASVVGRDFDLDVLSQLIEADEDQLIDVLEQATSAGLITESDDRAGHYRFVHALIQHSLYQDLSATRRQRAHHRVAEALEEVGSAADNDRLAELARHWMAATRPAETGKALYYARRAGEAALAAYSPLDAIKWYSQALDLSSREPQEDERERCVLLVGLGKAQRQAGQPDHRNTLLEAANIAIGLGDTELLVAAALAGTRGTARTAEADEEQVGILRAALDVVGDADAASRARLLAALTEVTDAREWELRKDLACEAMEIASGLSDESTVLDVVSRCYLPRAQPESSAERLAATARAISMADRLGDPVARLQTRFNRVHACMEAGDIAETDSRFDEMEALVNQTGLPQYQWQQSFHRSWRLLLSGDLAAAEAANNEALEIGTGIGAPEALAAYGGVLLEIRLQQGRLGEIADFVAQAAADNPAIAVLRAAVVEMYCTLGRVGEARELFEPDVTNGFADFPRDRIWTTAMTFCADSAVDLAHREAAQLLYAELNPFSEMVAFTQGSVGGALSRPLGRLAHLLGHWQDAESLFRASLSLHERLEAPYWIARTELDYSDLLIGRGEPGDVTRAEEMTRQALARAEEYGFGTLERRATVLLQLLG